MRASEFPDGALVLRAKIDMASPNLNMRDPVLYRIRHAEHHRTGDTWCIYPMYDYAHPLSDAIEKITHSICTLEFEDHRPLYDWLIEHVNTGATPQQIEFARGNLSYTVMSKRKLLTLVQEKHVAGWDDPRMPTISALRRRGVPPETIRAFWERMGVAKRNSTIDVAMLEHAIRADPLDPPTLDVGWARCRHVKQGLDRRKVGGNRELPWQFGNSSHHGRHHIGKAGLVSLDRTKPFDSIESIHAHYMATLSKRHCDVGERSTVIERSRV